MTAFANTLAELLKKGAEYGHDHGSWLKGRYEEIKGKIQPDLQEAVEVLCQQINSWGNVPHLEIEARIGFFNQEDDGTWVGPFDSDVGQEWFNKVFSALESCSYDMVKSVTTDYCVGDYRMTVDEKGQRCAMKKITMEHTNFNYENSPFDIRVSFSQETPIAIKEFNKVAKNREPTQRKKTRTTFYTNHWKFDLTRVEYTADSIDQAKHEVELEARLDNVGYVDYVYMADSMMRKIKMVTDFCETVEPGGQRKMVHLKNLSKKYVELDTLVNSLKKTSLSD